MSKIEANFVSTYENKEVIKALCHYDVTTKEITDIAYIDKPHHEGWGDAVKEQVEINGVVYEVEKKGEQYFAVNS